MNDWAWGQFALVGWGAACVFAAGARQKAIPLTQKTAFEIAQATVIVVVLFGLLTEGRGCANTGVTANAVCADGGSSC